MGALTKILNGRLGWMFIILFLVLVNWAASVWHSRIDLTNDKRFTLTGSTKNLLQKLDEPVQVDVFLIGNFPSAFRNLASATGDLLEEFREVAGNRLRYNFISPEENFPGSEGTYADSLDALGLLPLNLTSQLKSGQQQQFVYPFALVHHKGNTLPVWLYKGKSPLVSSQELHSAEAMLEYQFAEAIAKLTATEKTTVAYTIGNGQPMDVSVYDLVENVVSTDYNLVTFNLKNHPVIPKEIGVLMMVKPTEPFSEEDKLKLDQYIVQGGKVLWFIDRLEAEMDSLQILNEVVAYDRGLNLNDLFFRYGARVNADLVMDLQCDYLPFDVSGSGQFELLPWNYFPVLGSPNNHPVNKNMGFVAARFVNSIDTVEAEGIQKTILLSSSPNSRTIATPALISGRENVNAPEHELFRKQNIPVAVLLEGKFRSLYDNRLSQALRDTLQQRNQPFVGRGTQHNKMIIVADGDIVLNGVVRGDQPIPMGMNIFTYGTQREFPFANADFLRNCLSYLVDAYDLSQSKGKDYVARLLDTRKVEEEKGKWQLLNILVPVALVIFFGTLFQLLRKRKYTK